MEINAGERIAEDRALVPWPAAGFVSKTQFLHTFLSPSFVPEFLRRATGLSMFELLDYRGWPGRRLHSPRAERMKVKPPSPPSAQSVQTKKKPPVDLAISPQCAPLMCMTGMAAANN